MKTFLLTFALTFATSSSSLALPKSSYQSVELCRPQTNNVLRKTTQWLAYPTTPNCSRPYIRIHNSLTRSRSLPDVVGNVFSPYHRFEDNSGNKARACPTPTSSNQICF